MGDMDWAWIESQLMDFVYVGDVWRLNTGEEFRVLEMRIGPGQPLAWLIFRVNGPPGQILYQVDDSVFRKIFSLAERIDI